MRRAIREYAVWVASIVGIVMLATLSAYIIVQHQRLRIPIIEEKPFELKGDFQDANSVVAGLGQSVTVVGVKVGQVEDVKLKSGVAEVKFGIERKYLPIYRNATVLMRPRTGLKDMFFEIDPGSREAGEYREGDTIPESHTQVNIDVDEIIGAADTDTRDYLRTFLVGLGDSVDHRAKDIGSALSSAAPLTEESRRIAAQLARRKENVRNVVHSLNALTAEIAGADRDLERLVTSGNATVGAIASRRDDLQRGIALLPAAVHQARLTLVQTSRFASVAGPAFKDLLPVAHRLDEVSNSIRRLSVKATPAVRRQIRPLVRASRQPVRDLGVAASRYGKAAKPLTTATRFSNAIANMTAYNPRGAEPIGALNRDEGYLYWEAWFAHNGRSVYGLADGNSLFRRFLGSLGCREARGILDTLPTGIPLAGLNALFVKGSPCNP